MTTPESELRVSCPRCCNLVAVTPERLREHLCRIIGWNRLPQQDVDKVIAFAQREADSMDKPWGYDVLVTFVPGSGKPAQEFHKQGKESAVRRWAMMKPCAQSCAIVATYTRRQWINAYGDGRIRM